MDAHSSAALAVRTRGVEPLCRDVERWAAAWAMPWRCPAPLPPFSVHLSQSFCSPQPALYPREERECERAVAWWPWPDDTDKDSRRGEGQQRSPCERAVAPDEVVGTEAQAIWVGAALLLRARAHWGKAEGAASSGSAQCACVHVRGWAGLGRGQQFYCGGLRGEKHRERNFSTGCEVRI